MRSNYRELKIPFPACPGCSEGLFSIRGIKKNVFRRIPLWCSYSVGSGPSWEGKAELVGSERTNPTLCHGLTPTQPGTGRTPAPGTGSFGNTQGTALEQQRDWGRARSGSGSWRGTEEEMEQLSLSQGFCTGRARWERQNPSSGSPISIY